jgi:hypothetical protein
MLMSLMSLQTFVYAQGLELTLSERKPVHDKDIRKLSALEIMEDSLVYFADSMYYSGLPEQRLEANYEFIRMLKQFLKTPTSYLHPTKKLKDKITILQSPDQQFKLYNWEILIGEEQPRYYAVIQLKDGSTLPLVDVSDHIIRGAEDSVFTHTRWYGAIYYNILQKNISGQPIYFLIGWNGGQAASERKIIECFGFNSLGQHQFGAPLFNIIERGKRKRTHRFILEYQKGSKVTLNYDKETDQIVMDHCESMIGDPAKRHTYIPDGSYDGLRWEGNMWNMYEDIIQMQVLQDGSAPIVKPIK